MKKILKFAFPIVLSLVLLFSCSLEQIESIAEKMGNNVMGKVEIDLSSIDGLGSTATLDDLANNEEYAEYASFINYLKDEFGDDLPENIILPLSTEAANDIANLYYQNPEKLAELKNIKPTEEALEAITSTARLVADLIGADDLDEDEELTGESDIEIFINSFYTGINNLANGTIGDREINQGDVVAIQYSLAIIQEVNNTIAGVFEKANDKIDSITTLVNSMNEGTIDVNTILDCVDDAKDEVLDLIGQVSTFINVIGTCTDFTGGETCNSLLTTLIGAVMGGDN